MFLGIYRHPMPDVLIAAGGHDHEVADTWTNEAIAFASAYAAKSALWLKKIWP